MDIFPYTNGLGQFEFSFVSSNDYTSDMLEGVAMEICVYCGRIVKVRGMTSKFDRPEKGCVLMEP